MRPPLRPPRARPAPGIGRLASPVQSSPKLAASAMPRPRCAGAGAARLLQVDVLCGAGVLQVLLVVLQEGAAADRAPQHSAAALRPVNLLPGLRAARPPTPDSPAPWLLLTLPLSVERPSPAGPGPRPPLSSTCTPPLLAGPTLGLHSPHTLGHGPHRLLGDEDVAGEAAQQRVFSDEAEIAAGQSAWAASERAPPPQAPHGRRRGGQSRGLGRVRRGEACGTQEFEASGPSAGRERARFSVTGRPAAPTFSPAGAATPGPPAF